MQVNSYKIRSKFFTETHRQHPRINIQAIDFLLSKQPITVAEVDIGIDPEFLHIGIKQPAVLQIDIDTRLCNEPTARINSSAMFLVTY
jgi:hypothetical protein